jgi:hypothetical protein
MACARSTTCSFVRMLDRWLRTVFGLRLSRRATEVVEPPGDLVEHLPLSVGQLREGG